MNGKPGFWRELAAAVISPPTGFNRLAFGNRFDAVYPSHNPATFMRLQAGGTLTSGSHNVSSSIKEQWSDRRPHRYLWASWKAGLYLHTARSTTSTSISPATTANTFENINTRGLLDRSSL